RSSSPTFSAAVLHRSRPILRPRSTRTPPRNPFPNRDQLPLLPPRPQTHPQKKEPQAQCLRFFRYIGGRLHRPSVRGLLLGLLFLGSLLGVLRLGSLHGALQRGQTCDVAQRRLLDRSVDLLHGRLRSIGGGTLLSLLGCHFGTLGLLIRTQVRKGDALGSLREL